MKFAAPANRVDFLFRAFSDRTRLRILNLLKPGELCVCDLVRVLGHPQPKISRHLAYLRKAGLVTAQGGTLDALPAGPGQESISSEVDGVPFVLFFGPSRAGEGRQAASRRLLRLREILRLIFL